MQQVPKEVAEAELRACGYTPGNIVRDGVNAIGQMWKGPYQGGPVTFLQWCQPKNGGQMYIDESQLRKILSDHQNYRPLKATISN